MQLLESEGTSSSLLEWYEGNDSGEGGAVKGGTAAGEGAKWAMSTIDVVRRKCLELCG